MADGRLGRNVDMHFWQQVDVCQLEKFMPLYDFIGSQESVSAQSHLLLRVLGLWDEYGSHGWPGPQGEFLPPVSIAFHRTNSSQEVARTFTSELLERVKYIYKEDYQMIESLGLTPERPIVRRACTPEGRG